MLRVISNVVPKPLHLLFQSPATPYHFNGPTLATGNEQVSATKVRLFLLQRQNPETFEHLRKYNHGVLDRTHLEIKLRMSQQELDAS